MARIRVALAALLACLAAGTAVAAQGAEAVTRQVTLYFRNIGLLVNGREVVSDAEPFILEGKTFVPVRTVAEALGATVEWDSQRNWVLVNTPKGLVPVTELALVGNRKDVKAGTVTAYWSGTRYLNALYVTLPRTQSQACGSTAAPCSIELALNGQYRLFQGVIGQVNDNLVREFGASTTLVKVFVNDEEVDQFKVFPTNPPRRVEYDVRNALSIRFEFIRLESPLRVYEHSMFVAGSASP